MKAAVIHGYGEEFNILRYEDVATPEPGPGEVLVRVRASAVNHCDTDLRRGLYGGERLGVDGAEPFPWVMGVDACGEVAAIGAGVDGFSEGDRVSPHFMLSCGTCRACIDGKENICESAGILGVTSWGGYAEYVKCRPNHLIRIPDALSFEDAVAGQIPFATAWEALVEVAQIRAGESVLITAAGGGVGSAAVQIARLAGARVIAAAGSDDKLEKARALGADEVINYTTQDIGAACRELTDGRGVDAVLEMIGGRILKQSIDALAQGGRMAIIGAHGGEQVDIDVVEFFRKHITVHGAGRSTKAQVGRVLDLMATGKLKPVIHASYPLSDVATAHEVMQSRNFFGRMILSV
jgi:NADPH:quinone reductase-like Zn-dependent oxidoreductase